jgi:hypothetical protein
MVQIKELLTTTSEENTLITANDILQMLENNQSRVRILGGLLLTVCGTFASSSFIVLFFVLKEKEVNTPTVVPWLMFAATVGLTMSILFSILSALPPSPEAVRTKIELIDRLRKIYHREYQWVVWAVIFLLLAILLYIISLVIFALVAVPL